MTSLYKLYIGNNEVDFNEVKSARLVLANLGYNTCDKCMRQHFKSNNCVEAMTKINGNAKIPDGYWKTQGNLYLILVGLLMSSDFYVCDNCPKLVQIDHYCEECGKGSEDNVDEEISDE